MIVLIFTEHKGTLFANYHPVSRPNNLSNVINFEIHNYVQRFFNSKLRVINTVS